MSQYARNNKASFDYEILDTYEAGIVLSGQEVKSIRNKRAKLDGAFVIIRGGEAFIVNLAIPAYQAINAPKNYDPERPRKLLFSKKELDILDRATNTERLTAIPLSLYNKGRTIKVGVAIARGKKNFDKRESIKARDTKRDIDRTLKSQY